MTGEPMGGGIPDRLLVEHLLADQCDLGVIITDRAGQIVRWSAGVTDLLGWTAEDAVGADLGRFRRTPGQGIPELLAVRARKRGGATEARYEKADGGLLAVEERLQPVNDEDQPVGFCVILRDTASERAQFQDLLESRAIFEDILSIASDAVVCVSDDLRISFFNHGAEAIFGYTADEVLGERLELLIPEVHRARHEQDVRNFGASGVTSRRMGERGGITARRKNGEIFPAEASISHIERAEGSVFTAVLRDVTERRRAEETLAANTRELERSNAELEQFAYIASHDLQEPLRMVASYTQLLARRYAGKLDSDADEFIGYAVEGVSRMQALISDLLEYSRVGTRGSEPAPVDMESVLNRVLRALSPTVEEAAAGITHDPLPTVQGDATQLAQLLQNLIGNAIKFRDDAPARVHISAEETEGGWVFSVRDEGIGIEPQFQERIFEIFQRLHSRAEYPGTGIGLSICRKIVERHGGRIWFESTPGKQTTFYFTIARPGEE